MKNLELAPTEHNIIDTFLNGTLGRNSELYNFLQLLYTIDDRCSIALHGEWGSGKTFFVKQAKMLLDVANPYTMSDYAEDSELKQTVRENGKFFSNYANQNDDTEKPLYYTVYYDAWKNDNHEDPIMSLVYTIVKTTHIDLSKNEKSLGTVLKGLSKLFNFQITHTMYHPQTNSETEFNLSINGETIDDFLSSLKERKPYKNIDEDEEIKAKVKELLDIILVEKADRLVIFIDELDRCKPTYAVTLLERIKHYFDNDRITFVFSVNLSELQHTIKCLYGENFNATRYLDKFFDLSVGIPQVNKKHFVENCLKIDFRQHGYREKVIYRILDAYNMQLREIARFINIVEIATKHICQRQFIMELPEERGKPFVIYLIVPIVIALKMTDGTQYKNFIEGKDSSPLFSVAYNEELKTLLSWLSDENAKDPFAAYKSPLVAKEKLEAAYNAIFSEWAETGNHRIGKCAFNSEHRNLIFELQSLLSNLVDYNTVS